jgi:hypothetical protein
LPGGDKKHKKAQNAQRERMFGQLPLGLLCLFAVIRLEVALARFVTAIAIELDYVAGAFARRAAILLARLRCATAWWVLTFFFVSHDPSWL